MFQLTTSHWSLTTAFLLRFLVRLVLAAAVTELLELQTAGGRLLVLRRRVVPLLALSALQCDNFPHFKSFQVTDDRLQMTVSNSALQTVICQLYAVSCLATS
jgi:hypothetical protein